MIIISPVKDILYITMFKNNLETSIIVKIYNHAAAMDAAMLVFKDFEGVVLHTHGQTALIN